jgi:hypothetical protein
MGRCCWLAVAAAALLGAYLLGLDKAPGSPPRPTPFQATRTAVQFLAAGIGPAGAARWPATALLPLALAVGVLLKLAHDWRALPAERLRTLGLLCFGGALLCLAAGVGWGRGSLGPEAGFATRYATMAVPALCLAYFVSRSAARPVAWGLFLVAAGLLVVNTSRGLDRAADRRARMRELQADVARGLTPDELAARWAGPIFGPGGEAFVADRFEMLRRARQGPYRRRTDDR